VSYTLATIGDGVVARRLFGHALGLAAEPGRPHPEQAKRVPDGEDDGDEPSFKLFHGGGHAV